MAVHAPPGPMTDPSILLETDQIGVDFERQAKAAEGSLLFLVCNQYIIDVTHAHPATIRD